MTPTGQPLIRIALACGGTGGHLFPGLAVADQLLRRGCRTTLLVSAKEVDQQAAKMSAGMDLVTLPAVGLTPGRRLAFLRGFIQSYRAAKKVFWPSVPHAALAMGGFTGAPPLLAAKRLGARTFLHESNTIPGRANRWLSWMVDHAFVGFPSAAARLYTRNVTVTGTPVRPQFQPREAGACRAALGLEPERPVVLVMGGSQGASGLNHLMIQSVPLLARLAPEWQWFHLAGPTEAEKVAQAYAASRLKAVVQPFFAEMDTVLNAATAVVSRAGASSLAEIAALRLPAVLIPYPAATDNHQYHNARAFEASGAAQLLEQKDASAETLARLLVDLVKNPARRGKMQSALARWHAPGAAEQIAERICLAVSKTLSPSTSVQYCSSCSPSPQPSRSTP